MINLSLDFSFGEEMPDNIIDFKKILDTREFQYWFKIVWLQIIPLTWYKDNIWESNLIYSYSDIEDMFERLNDWKIKESFYIVKENELFNFYIDKDVNAWLIEIKSEKSKVVWKITKVLNNIFWENISDPYVTKIVKTYLEDILWYKDMIQWILKITNKKDNIIVKYNRYYEKDWWDPEAEDYYTYGWAMNTYIEKIKKWDLI